MSLQGTKTHSSPCLLIITGTHSSCPPNSRHALPLLGPSAMVTGPTVSRLFQPIFPGGREWKGKFVDSNQRDNAEPLRSAKPQTLNDPCRFKEWSVAACSNFGSNDCFIHPSLNVFVDLFPTAGRHCFLDHCKSKIVLSDHATANLQPTVCFNKSIPISVSDSTVLPLSRLPYNVGTCTQ